MLVYKCDAQGRQVWSYPVGRLLSQTAQQICFEAFFNRPDDDLGYVIFKKGDRFVEYFYKTRWYNIFAVYDRDDGRHKGWYCNICRPAQWDETRLTHDDLALDVWVTPAGETLILDEDEFAALLLTAEERHHAQAALQTLLELAQNGHLPR